MAMLAARVVKFVAPQVVFPLGFALGGLVLSVVHSFGGLSRAWADFQTGSGSFPAARIGDARLLVVLAFVFAVLLITFAFAITIAGVMAALTGFVAGFVTSFLYDWIRLRRRKDLSTPSIIKLWAGRGALAVTLFSLFLLISNPLSKVAGVYTWTGVASVIVFGLVGAIVATIRRKPPSA